MSKRTTLVLNDKTYTLLVEESLRRYGTPRAISRVVDKMVEQSVVTSPREMEKGLLRLLYARKIAKTTEKDFEQDRRMLSKRFERLRGKQ